MEVLVSQKGFGQRLSVSFDGVQLRFWCASKGDELELGGYQLASFGMQLEVIGESEMDTVRYYL